jgi:hypothetical protein
MVLTGTMALLAKMRVKKGGMPATSPVSGSFVANPIAAYNREEAYPNTNTTATASPATAPTKLV